MTLGSSPRIRRDVTIERIGDLLAYDLSAMRAASRAIDPTTARG